VLKESEAGSAAGADAEERFLSDFTLMAGELSSLLAGVVEALGGPLPDARLDPTPHLPADGPPRLAKAA
jgi:hypothetical protein